MLMRDTRLRAFHAVATHQSFTRAAKHINSSQQAISLHVRQLELEVGARLLVRGQKQAELTDEGKRLFEYAEKIVALYTQAENAMAELTGKERVLRVAITNSLTNLNFATAIKSLQKVYAGVEVEIDVGHSTYCIERLLDHSADLAIVSEGIPGHQLQVAPFINDEIVIITAANGPFSSQASMTLSDLKSTPFILRTGGSGTRATFETRLRDAGFSPESLNVAMTLGSADSVKRSVLSGVGIGAVSRLSVEHELRDGTLVALRLEDVNLNRQFVSARRSGGERHRLIRAFLAAMNDETGSTAELDTWAALSDA